MNTTIDIKATLDETNIHCNKIQFQKMLFLFNALEDGWSVEKIKDKDQHKNRYLFTKKHENRKEILHEKYLETFMKGNCNVKKTLT